jgi:V/A-type H+-transporting ATPase subunit D
MEKVSPTRMHLLMLKQQLLIAGKGLDLLESKRAALVREFVTTAGTALTAREDLRQGMQNAQNVLNMAMAVQGREAVASVAFAARRELAIELVEKNIWGVRFPDLRHQSAVRALDARGYAITGTAPQVDETARRFEEVLDRVLKTVSVEMKLKRIGQEIKKATRRINALKERVLPTMRFQMREIKNVLDEREHEDLFRIKRFKTKRETAHLR